MLIVAATLLAWVAMALVTLYSYRHVFRLEDSGEPRDGDPAFPRLSVVVAARNEELGAEQGLSSLLALDYPDYEVIFVDDRSDDGTGEIAHRGRAPIEAKAMAERPESPEVAKSDRSRLRRQCAGSDQVRHDLVEHLPARRKRLACTAQCALHRLQHRPRIARQPRNVHLAATRQEDRQPSLFQKEPRVDRWIQDPVDLHELSPRRCGPASREPLKRGVDRLCKDERLENGQPDRVGLWKLEEVAFIARQPHAAVTASHRGGGHPYAAPIALPCMHSFVPLAVRRRRGARAGGEDRQDRRRAEAGRDGHGAPPRNAFASGKHRSRSRPTRRRNRRDCESLDRLRRDGRGPRARPRVARTRAGRSTRRTVLPGAARTPAHRSACRR